jgi:NTE family protein
LNGGETRFTVATVDLETGDPVIFDTGAGQRIELDHILASAGFIPEFAPVEIGGQLLGDGGLALNAPVEPMLDALEQSGGTILIADLFARDGERPRGLEAALERKNALMFGNQTWCRLDLYRRLWQQNGVAGPIILYLSYRPTRDEAGAEASFDFSRASAEDRWREGSLDADAAIRRLPAVHASGEVLTAIRRV